MVVATLMMKAMRYRALQQSQQRMRQLRLGIEPRAVTEILLPASWQQSQKPRRQAPVALCESAASDQNDMCPRPRRLVRDTVVLPRPRLRAR